MKRLLFLTVLWAVTGFLLPSRAQINCGTDQITELMRRRDPKFFAKKDLHQDRIQQFRNNYPNFPTLPTTPPPTGKKQSGGAEMGGSSALIAGSTCRRAQFIIPVVVHVFHSSTDGTPGTGSNISDAQIEDQIAALNKAYANELGSTNPAAVNTGIQFCLAQVKPDGSSFDGIIRVQNDALDTCYQDVNRWDAQINQSYYPEDRYLNVYVVKDILDSNGVNQGVLGFAVYPYSGFKHGVVIRADEFGNTLTCTGCNLATGVRGITLVHEIAHYLGVMHTFDGGCIGDCATKGDLCCDTPPIPGPSLTCGTVNTCHLDVPDLNDQVENFMDYSGQSCQTMFTRDQLSIMHSTLYGFYTNFWKPQNVNALNLACCLNSAWFSASRNFLCQGESATLYAYQYDSAQYRWRIERNGSLVFTITTSADSLVRTFNDTGRFDIILTVRHGTDSISDTLRKYMEVRTCGPTLASTQGNWYFGSSAGIRFTENGPIRDLGPFFNPPNTDSDEGAAVISDRNGKLLYYAGGDAGENGTGYHIYDDTYQEIEGSPVIGDGSAVQAGLFLPFPGDTNRIYLVTASSSESTLSGGTHANGLRYNIIDRDSNAVIVNSRRIYVPNYIPNSEDTFAIREALCVIPTCEDSTYWMYVVGNALLSDSIYTYRVDTTITFVRSTYAPGLPVVPLLAMKASPDAKWLTVHNLFFKVNRATGKLTLRWNEPSAPALGITGVSFSPDSRYVYRLESTASSYFDTAARNNLTQFDLQSSNDSLSKIIVSQVPRYFDQLQIAPDGKIYISSGGNNYLGVIHSPNEKSTSANVNACGYQQVGPLLSVAGVGGLCKFGLPNFVNAGFASETALDFFHIDTTCLTVRFIANQDCYSSYKWSFGDGGTSTQREPVYTYPNSGSYVVQLIGDADTVTKLLTFGMPAPVVSTDSIFCDTTTSHFITISNRNDEYTYTFTAPTAKITVVPSSTEVRIVWKADGDLTVTAYDPATGCSNSTVVHAKLKTLTNTISAPVTEVCPSDTSFILTGNQLDTNGAVASYQWYSSVDGVNFLPISGATGKNYKPNAGASYWAADTFFQRLALYESGCMAFSNTWSISRSVVGNVINPSNACVKGSAVNLTGLAPGVHYALWNYQWQKSYDTLTWVNIVGATSQNLSTTLDSELVYYRRLVVAPGLCEAPSNVVKAGATLYIAAQPQNTTVCGLGASYVMNVGMNNPNGLSLTYTWQVKESGSLVWAFLGSGNPLFTSTGKSFTDGDTIRCLVNSNCGSLYSKNAILYINNLSPSLGTLLNKSVSEGSSLTLNLLTTPPTGNTYNWQVSYDGGTNWNTIKTGSDNTLVISAMRPCDAGLYRAVVTNICGTVISNSSTVTVGQTHTWDVWMRDTWGDNGTEGVYSFDIFNSPDLWVRNRRDGGLRHQNPIRDYMPGQPNYVYARVRNKGASATLPSELYLYWTKASTHEMWPTNWTASTSNRILNWLDGQFYPLGGEINTIPISIPAIAAGDSVIISYPWTPPSPSWYMFFENGQPRAEIQSHICLLGRVVTCPNPMYGMTYREGHDIVFNVSENNNIVTKNLTVSRIDVSQLRQITGIAKIANPNLGLDTVKMKIKVVNPTIFNFAKVIVHMDDDLYSYWVNGGSQKTGLTLLGANQLELTTSTAEISNLFIPGSSKGYFYLEYQLKSGVSVMPDSLYEITVQQWNGPADADVSGGLHFQLAIGSSGLTAKKANNLAVNSTAEQASWVKVYPNPFSGETKVVFDLDQPEQVSINLYDMAGKLVQSIPAKRYEAGQHQETINGAELADGIYYCKIKAGSKLVNEKLILLKAQ